MSPKCETCGCTSENEPQHAIVELVKPGAVLPSPAYQDDVGGDLINISPVFMKPSQIKTIDIGLKVQPPKGYFIKLETRSSMAKRGVICLGGIVDPGYRGLVGVILKNLNEEHAIHLATGTKIAQACIMKCLPASHFRLGKIDEIAEEQRENREDGEDDWAPDSDSETDDDEHAPKKLRMENCFGSSN